MLRVWFVEFVCYLDFQNFLYYFFGNRFLLVLFEKYQELVQIFIGNIFINFLVYRQKNRLMQFALFLELFILQVCLCYVLIVMYCIISLWCIYLLNFLLILIYYRLIVGEFLSCVWIFWVLRCSFRFGIIRSGCV